MFRRTTKKKKTKNYTPPFFKKASPIAKIGYVDENKIIAGIAAVNKTYKENPDKFNQNYLNANLRVNDVLEECFMGGNHNQQKGNIKKITSAEYLLNKTSVKVGNLPNYEQKIKLAKEGSKFYFKSFSKISGNDEDFHNPLYEYEKTECFQYDKPTIIKYIEEDLDFSNHNISYSQLTNPDISPNTRIAYSTILLNSLLADQSISDLAKSFQKNLQGTCDDKLTLGLVGPLRGRYKGEIVIHFSQYIEKCTIPSKYKSDTKPELSNIDVFLDNFLASVLENNAEFQNLIKACAELREEVSNIARNCFVTKVIAKPRGFKGVIVFYTLTFSGDILKEEKDLHSEKNDLPSRRLYDSLIKRKLEDDLGFWDIGWINHKKKIPSFTIIQMRNVANKLPIFSSASVGTLAFITINNGEIAYADVSGKKEINPIQQPLEEFLYSLQDLDIPIIRCYPLGDESAVIVKGSLFHTEQECELLSQTMKDVGLEVTNSFVSSLVGTSYYGDYTSDEFDDEDGYDDEFDLGDDPGTLEGIDSPDLSPLSVINQTLPSVPTTTVTLTSKVIMTPVIAAIIIAGGITGVSLLDSEMFSGIDSSNFLIDAYTDSIFSSYEFAEDLSNDEFNGWKSDNNGKGKINGNSKSFADATYDTFSEPTPVVQETISNDDVTSTQIGLDSGSRSNINRDKNEFNLTPPGGGPFPGPFDDPQGIATDEKGNIYVSDTNNHVIKIYDSDGNRITEFGGEGTEPGKFSFPAGIAIAGQGNIIVADGFNSRVQIFNSDREFITSFGEIGSGSGKLRGVSGVVIDSQGNIIVTDVLNSRVQKFDSDGKFITSFGGFGSNSGQFIFPAGITTDSQDNIYVADYVNSRVQKFDSFGTHLDMLGGNCFLISSEKCLDEEGWTTMTSGHRCQVSFLINNECLFSESSGIVSANLDDGEFIAPVGVLVDDKDNLYVSDLLAHNIQKFDSNGKFIKKIGEFGTNDGQLIGPTGLTFDINGDILVIENGNERIQKISFEGALAKIAESLDGIECNSDSMINNPVSFDEEIIVSLPISKLLSSGNKISEIGQFNEALIMYYAVSQIQPNNVDAWNGIGYSQTFLCTNNSPVLAYQKTLDLDSRNVNAFNGLGLFYERQAQDDEIAMLNVINAKLNYQKALDIDPNNINALNGLGNSKILQEDYLGAIEEYDKSLQVDDKRITTLNGMAYAQYKNNNLGSENTCNENKGSLCYYEEALEQDKNNFNALSGLILIYSQQEKITLVDTLLEKLEQHKDIVADKLVEEGNWLLEQGQTEEATRLFTAAEKIRNS